MSEPEQPVWAHSAYPEPVVTGSHNGSSLGGFFSGVVWVIVVPGLLLTLVNVVAPDDTLIGAIAACALALAVPIALLFPGRTRRFGGYMLIGMTVTVIVLAGVLAAFVALLMAGDGS
jgi:hypothetical protein